jgi:hypothetical protein
MVDQLLLALQEALPGVEIGADHLDRRQAFIDRVVTDGQRRCCGRSGGRC